MATIVDVAKLAGVNISTVSRALGGKYPVAPATKQKILDAVKLLDYKPNLIAKGLKSSHTMLLGLLVPATSSTVFSSIADHVEATARQYGYYVIICNTGENRILEKEYIARLKNKVVDGFLCATAMNGWRHLLELQKETPLVLLVRRMRGAVASVSVDDYQGAYAATDYLLGKGCRRVGLINGEQKISVYREREKGYRQALRDRGISPEPAIVRNDLKTGSSENAYLAVRDMLAAGHRPDALFATTDSRAAAAIAAVKERGLRVPEDIRVLGFGDLEIAGLTAPALTTMAQPLETICRRGVERLVARINGGVDDAPAEELYQATLIQRGSA